MEPQFEFLESYSKFPLAVCLTYGSVHISMLLFPSVPPSSPRRAHTSVLYVHVSSTALQTGYR